MATAQRITLTTNAAATVAALNVAVGIVAASPNFFLAPPVDLGGSLLITSSSLATPNAYTGLTFDSIPSSTLALDMAAVGTFMSAPATPVDQGLRWIIPTRFGYHLVVRGQPAGPTNVYGTQLFTFDAGDNTSSTNSAGFVTYINQTTGTLPIGTYRLDWQHETRNNVATSICEAAVFLDAVEIGRTAILGPGAAQFCTQSGFKVQAFVAAATHTVLVQWRSSPGGGGNNAQIRRGRLALYRAA